MIEKLISKVNTLLGKLYIPCGIPADKQMHFISGLIIAAVLTPFIGWYSTVVVSIIATAKEVYDYLNKAIHTPDTWDLVVTVLGGALGFVLINLL
jgi:hypothetical protein